MIKDGYTLKHKSDKIEVNVGDKVTDTRNLDAYIIDAHPPEKRGSGGFVETSMTPGGRASPGLYYVSVYNLYWEKIK